MEGHKNQEIYKWIKSKLTDFYKCSEDETEERKIRGKRSARLLSLLFFPYLVLSVLYFAFRWQEVKKINWLFFVVLLIAATWFIIGPRLVQRFIWEIMSLQSDDKLPMKVKEYFIKQEDRHFTYFIKYRLVETLLFVIVAIVPILCYPYILSKNITSGYSDCFFWFIILFLIWFLSYCVNATAFISLLSFHILPDMRKDKIFIYNPLLEDHRYTIKKIKEICGKAVRYVCSAIVFIPGGIYYFYQQPEIVAKNGQLLYSSPASSQHPIYFIWVVLMLLFYSFFLFFFLTYQNVQIQGYSKAKGNECVLKTQLGFVSETNEDKPKGQSGPFSIVAYRYTEYLKLQEIKLLCKTNATVDINVVLTYISIVVSIITAIQGILKIIETTAP